MHDGYASVSSVGRNRTKKVLGLMGGRQFLLHDYKKQRQTIFEKKNLDF